MIFSLLLPFPHQSCEARTLFSLLLKAATFRRHGQQAHLRFVTGLGWDLKPPTLIGLPETDKLHSQLESRYEAGECLTEAGQRHRERSSDLLSSHAFCP